MVVKEEMFLKSFCNDFVISVEEFKEIQVVYLFQDCYGMLQFGFMKIWFLGVIVENKCYMVLKGVQDWDDEKFYNDFYSVYDLCVEEV